MSSIPPPSTLRRPSYRPSLAPNSVRRPQTSADPPHRQSIAVAPARMTGSNNGVHGRPATEGPRNSIRQSMVPMGRQSIAPMSNSRQSAVPMSSRPSSFGLFPSSTGSAPTRDPRPLRDKGYQAMITEAIQEYLVSHHFEIEMKHPLTPKTLKSPTQKDFTMLFHWLYRRLDPGYRFTRSIDQEAYFLLRAVQYPYLESINKSQIGAVGGQNWPVLLGMLYWLVQLNKTFEVYDNKEFDGIQETDDMILDQMFTRYVSKSYRAFLANEDDYSEYEAEMEREFADYTSGVTNELKELENERVQLNERMIELNKNAQSLQELEGKGEALESDLVKFKAFLDSLEQRKLKYVAVMDKLKSEIGSHEQALQTLEMEKNSLQAQISSQGLTPADIDRMNAEREKLSKSLDVVGLRLEEASRMLSDKELSAQRALESLESSLQNYSTALYRIGISTSNIANDVSLNIPVDQLLIPGNLGKKPDEILDKKDIRNVVRPALQHYRQEISLDIHKAQDECIRLQEFLDRAAEEIQEKREMIETMEARLHADKLSYDEIYETMNSDSSASNAEIERLERELNSMKVTAQQGILQVTQRSQRIAIEFDQLKHAIALSRSKMNTDVEKMISYIINFKLHIQSTLEDYENFVVEESAREDGQV